MNRYPVVLLLLALTVLSATTVSALSFQATDLGEGAGWSINNSGNVLLVAPNGAISIRGSSGTTDTGYYGYFGYMNDSQGMVVKDPNGVFTVKDGVAEYHDFPARFSSFLYPSKINCNGDVAGMMFDQVAGTSSGFLLQNGVVTEITNLNPGTQTWAYGINDDGVVVGYTSASGVKAFSWTKNGGMIDLWSGLAFDLNNAGQICGQAEGSAYLWDPIAGGQSLGTMLDGPSSATHINNYGGMIGSYGYNNGLPFYWDIVSGVTFLPIPEDADPNTEVFAYGINDDNWIVGYYLRNDGEYRALLWEPEAAVPEPSSFIALVVGIIGCCRIKRRP